MMYYYFEKFNFISSLFGMNRPIASASGKLISEHLVHKVWTIIILAIIVGSYYITTIGVKFDSKDNLDEIFDLNDVATNGIIVIFHLLSDNDLSVNICELINNTINGMKLNEKCLKLFSMKLYMWFSLPTVMFTAAITLEVIFDKPAYILMYRIPTYFAIFHLYFHICLMIAILKVININLDNSLGNDKTINMNHKAFEDKTSTVKYLIDFDISFVDYKQNIKNLDLKLLCTMYDYLSTSVKLLENLHGVQILFTIWLAFSSAVVGVTIIVCHQEPILWLEVVKSTLPYFWCFIGCYIGDQMKKEVERTEMLIIKHLIDFRCDQTRKYILETFKQLINVNRLQFTACNLFDLSYSMILGMLMNIITYSIILIQFFISN